MILASAPTIPWWTLPAVLLSLLGIYSFWSNGRGISRSGLSGDKSSVWKGQSARSVAETAANSAVALSLRIDELEKEGEKKDETIKNLKLDVARLERLVTQATWGESLMKQMDVNHKEVLQVLAALAQTK